MRLASLGGLPVTALADRFGRRMMLLGTVGAGLAMTVVAAASPGYWWFVAIFACGRPLLSASNGLAQVTAAEQTASADRARAVALVAAGYGAGAGVVAIVHSLASRTPATDRAEAEGILDRIDLLAAERQRSLARLHHVEQALRKLAEQGQPLIRDGQPVTDPRTGQVLKDPAFPGRVQAALEELRRVRELITGLPAEHDDS